MDNLLTEMTIQVYNKDDFRLDSQPSLEEDVMDLLEEVMDHKAIYCSCEYVPYDEVAEDTSIGQINVTNIRWVKS